MMVSPVPPCRKDWIGGNLSIDHTELLLSLLDIQLLPERQRLLTSERPAGCCCAIGCRKMLDEKAKVERRLRRKDST